MKWKHFYVATDRSHHILPDGSPAYDHRFDEVLSFHAPGIAAARIGSEAWHIFTDGSPAYAFHFDRVFGFYEGLAAVLDKKKWHHIVMSGKEAYASRFAWCGNFQNGRCSVRDNDGAYLHIDHHGEPAYPERWRYAGDYRNGIAVAQAENGLSTHIDLNGQLTHGHWFIDLDIFHKGFARARDQEGWMHISMDGAPAYIKRFAEVEHFYNGQARVTRFDDGIDVIDENGETIIEVRKPRRSEFAALSDDMAGFWRTQTIAAAVKLGIFDALPCREAEVAMRCNLRLDGARRILRALGELHLASFEKPIWHPTDRGKLLRSGHPLTLADAAVEYADPFSQSWQHLPKALASEGEWKASNLFETVSMDEQRVEGHHRMLQSYARHDYPLAPEALALSGNERIIDAGGGTGTLASMLINAYPDISVTVFDRKEVIEIGRRKAAAKNHHLHWHSGEILSPWGLMADVVILSRVLHDWEDDAAQRILDMARKALSENGRLMIMEMLLSENSFRGALCDLHLLMLTGGRERTIQEYERMLNKAGFVLAEARKITDLSSLLVGWPNE